MDQLLSVKVFFATDSFSTNPKDKFPGWCQFATIERFEESNMAARSHFGDDFFQYISKYIQIKHHTMPILKLKPHLHSAYSPVTPPHSSDLSTNALLKNFYNIER